MISLEHKAHRLYYECRLESRLNEMTAQRDALLAVSEDIIALKLELNSVIEDRSKSVAEYLDEYNDALFNGFVVLHRKAVAATASTRNFNC